MEHSTPSFSRRTLVKTAAGLAAGFAAARLGGGEARAADAAQRFARQAAVNPRQRILLKGGTIISMDGRVGDLAKGDVLIEGTKIAAVGANLSAAGAQIIDASNMILIPGFVDCHRHSWEGQLRRINPNAPTLADYANATHLSFATHYRPQDMYVGGMITALGCIDAGITCVIDNSHNARSAGHSDAAVEALFDSGIRAVHASGAPQAGEWDRQWPQDLTRLQKTYFSSPDQLVTLRMFSGPNRDNWNVARRLGLRITSEFQGPMAGDLLDPLWQEKMVGPDNTFNHCGALPERTWQILRESGATVDVCPRSDAQYALGEGISAYQHALDHGIKPGFSVDNETSYSSDMFAEMRVAFYMQRALAQNRKFGGQPNIPAPVNVRDVLEAATVNGANCAGLADKIGSIAPGKEADLVMIRADDINLYPSNNALGTVVQAADRSNVDTVIIGGQIRKLHGRIVDLDMNRLKRMVEESRSYLFAKVNYKEDLFAERLPKLF
ncbi:MAG TPA: amidohydrolase family protein [Micropepsaceae bacterium]|nr:amidohydrolase family protein [Micropepsaceae bacterium]